MRRGGQLGLVGLAVGVAVLVLAGCAPCSFLPFPGVGPEMQFGADQEVVPAGGCTMLHWRLSTGDQYPVFLNGREVPPEGQEEVCLDEPATYELVVGVPGGSVRQTVSIQVEGQSGGPGPGEEQPPEGPGPGEEPGPGEGHPPEEPEPGEQPAEEPEPRGGPEIVNLVVDPDTVPRGACAVLHWEVLPPDWPVSIDGQESEPTGERHVCPEQTTTYRLVVEAPEGPQERSVTLTVEGEGPGPQPTAQPPAPPAATATSQPAGPTATPQPTASGGLSADVRPSDLYPDKQPQGNIWVRVVNDGPGTLTNKKVSISGVETRSTKTSPPSAQGSNILGAEYVLNLAPGQQQNINLGWSFDLSQYNYTFKVTVQAVDFTDPKSGNNTYEESFQLAATPAPGATLNLHNHTTKNVCYVYIRQTGQSSWGSNQLGTGESVLSGNSRSWQIPAGTYDMRAEECNTKQYLGGQTGAQVSGTHNWCIGVC